MTVSLELTFRGSMCRMNIGDSTVTNTDEHMSLKGIFCVGNTVLVFKNYNQLWEA